MSHRLPNIPLDPNTAIYLVDPAVIDDYYLEHHDVTFSLSIQQAAPFLMMVTKGKAPFTTLVE